VFGEFDVNDETDERTPGPTWAGTRLVSLTPCVGECMFASPDSPCDCRCGGDNHAIGGAMFISAMIDAIAAGDTKAAKVAIKAARPVMLTPKPCTCGCGGLTLRRFVPGHDARYHAAIKAGFATVAEHAAAKAQAAQVKAQSRDSKEQHAQLQSDKAAAKAADAALPF
jgi:hypothetical protein